MKIETLKNRLVNLFPIIEIRKRLVIIFLLGAWALIQYSLGNKFYAIFIIVFFIILIVFRPPFFMLIAASVLVIALFNTTALDTLMELRQSNLSAVQNPKLPLTNIFSPNSGQEVLPDQVQEMLSLLHTHHIASYQISKPLEQDLRIYQRIIEAAWPIKYDGTSPYLFISLNDVIINPNCDVIDQRKDVALEYCH